MGLVFPAWTFLEDLCLAQPLILVCEQGEGRWGTKAWVAVTDGEQVASSLLSLSHIGRNLQDSTSYLKEPKGCPGLLSFWNPLLFPIFPWLAYEGIGPAWASEELVSSQKQPSACCLVLSLQFQSGSLVAVIMKHLWNFPEDSFLPCGCLQERMVSVNSRGDVCKWSNAMEAGETELLEKDWGCTGKGQKD